MMLWEMLAHRLRRDGWLLWHRAEPEAPRLQFVVHLHQPGRAWQARGKTLTEAYLEAARRSRQDNGRSATQGGPHLGRSPGAFSAKV